MGEGSTADGAAALRSRPGGQAPGSTAYERSTAMRHSTDPDRRAFLAMGAAAGAAVGLSGVAAAAGPGQARGGGIGCGSVSHSYLPHLSKSPHVELVSACDIIPERARAQAERFKIPNRYPHIDKMLPGAPFDLMVNLTDMQEHERLNRQA